jgi:Flp pilus assembly pilin Flp
VTKQRGQGLAEYGLVLTLIAIVAIVALIVIGHDVSNLLSRVGASVSPRTRSQPLRKVLDVLPSTPQSGCPDQT